MLKYLIVGAALVVGCAKDQSEPAPRVHAAKVDTTKQPEKEAVPERSDELEKLRAENASLTKEIDGLKAKQNQLDDDPNQPKAETKATSPKTIAPPPKPPEPSDTNKDGSRLGDAVIAIEWAVLDKVSITEFQPKFGAGSSTADGLYFNIRLQIKNASKTKKLTYFGWANKDHATLTDDLGNKYDSFGTNPNKKIVGQVANSKISIYPGEAEYDLLVFERPVGAAKYLKLELPGAALGNSGKLELKFSRLSPKSWTLEKPNP